MSEPTGQPPVVHVVDDDAAVRKALSRVLTAEGLDVRGHAGAGAFVDALEDRQGLQQDGTVPGCALFDLQMPGTNGLELQRMLADRGVELPVIFLSGHGDVTSSVQAMKGGALDFLEKPVSADRLVAAVGRALDIDRSRRLARDAQSRWATLLSRLTPRETEVLDGIVAGRLNKQIAGDLGIAEKTVKVHRQRVMQKLEVRTLAELVGLVVRHRDASPR